MEIWSHKTCLTSEKMKENKEFYWKKEFLEKSPIKVSKSFFNEIFKFLFICQGQVDTWHYLRGLLEFSPFNNLEFGNKISISHDFQPFRTKRINFAWSCEISGATTALVAFWTISHDCAKFSHIHAKQLPFLQSIFLIWSISLSRAKFLHDHANLQHLIFELPFIISSISFFWFHFNYLQLA